eukprot:COSAG01_NODE_13987_length_1510_cov_2.891566_2_plen_57_part_00
MGSHAHPNPHGGDPALRRRACGVRRIVVICDVCLSAAAVLPALLGLLAACIARTQE